MLILYLSSGLFLEGESERGGTGDERDGESGAAGYAGDLGELEDDGDFRIGGTPSIESTRGRARVSFDGGE